MIRRLSISILTMVISAVGLSAPVIALSPPANELYGVYQVDFVAINSPTGSPTITESQVRNWVTQMNNVYNTITSGKIKLEFRTLYPTQSSAERITTPVGLKEKFPNAAVPKSATAVKAILVGVISKDSSVGFAGIATSGGDEIILNGLNEADEVNVSVLVHEFGHNLSLAHANSANCTNTADLASCTLTEYGDYSDIMGKYIKSYVSYDNRFNGISLIGLGLIPTEQIYLANSTIELDLQPLYSTQSGYKVIYLPLYNRMGYAVEYRPAVGMDAWLTQTQVYGSGNWYYNNTPSYGLQVRLIGSQESTEERFLPKTDPTSNTIYFNNNRNRQGLDAGESINLPDGSVVRFVSGAGDAAVKVRIERPADTTAPRVVKGELEFEEQKGFPLLKVNYDGLTDDRYISKLELLVNSSVVTTLTNPGNSGTIDYQLTSGKPYTYQLVATDTAGNKTSSAITNGKVACSDAKCYVGATWEYQGPSFGPKLNAGQLQQLVNNKWVVRAKASPVKKDGLYTYLFKYAPTKAGTATYRFYIPPSSKWAAFIGKSFKQKIIG